MPLFPDSGIARTVNYMPARTVIAVADLPMGAAVQVEAVVSHGDGTPPQAIEDRHGLMKQIIQSTHRSVHFRHKLLLFLITTIYQLSYHWTLKQMR